MTAVPIIIWAEEELEVIVFSLRIILEKNWDMIFFRFWLVHKFRGNFHRNGMTSKSREGNKANSIGLIVSRGEKNKLNPLVWRERLPDYIKIQALAAYYSQTSYLKLSDPNILT